MVKKNQDQQNKSNSTPSKSKPAQRKARNVKKTASAGDSTPQQAQTKSVDDRRHMIAEAAYYIAAQRNYQGDNCIDDWLCAEAEITKQLGNENRL